MVRSTFFLHWTKLIFSVKIILFFFLLKSHEKIKQVRNQLGLSQVEFAEQVGVVQNDVSKLEKGQKKFIPKKYIDFLIENNYDLNTVFNDNLVLSKLGSEPLEEDMFPELGHVERSSILDYLLEQKDVLKALAQEGIHNKGKYSLEDRVRKLEAITAILLMRVKLSKEEFENK